MTIGRTSGEIAKTAAHVLQTTGDIVKGVVAAQAGGTSGKGGWPPAFIKKIDRDLIEVLRLTEELEELLRKIRDEMAKSTIKVPTEPRPDPKLRSKTKSA